MINTSTPTPTPTSSQQDETILPAAAREVQTPPKRCMRMSCHDPDERPSEKRIRVVAPPDYVDLTSEQHEQNEQLVQETILTLNNMMSKVSTNLKWDLFQFVPASTLGEIAAQFVDTAGHGTIFLDVPDSLSSPVFQRWLNFILRGKISSPPQPWNGSVRFQVVSAGNWMIPLAHTPLKPQVKSSGLQGHLWHLLWAHLADSPANPHGKNALGSKQLGQLFERAFKYYHTLNVGVPFEEQLWALSDPSALLLNSKGKLVKKNRLRRLATWCSSSDNLRWVFILFISRAYQNYFQEQEKRRAREQAGFQLTPERFRPPLILANDHPVFSIRELCEIEIEKHLDQQSRWNFRMALGRNTYWSPYFPDPRPPSKNPSLPPLKVVF